MELLLERKEIAAAGPLNLARREKVLTLLAPLGLMAAVAAIAVGSWTLAALAFAVVVAIVAGNAAMLRWFVEVRGWRFALGVVPLRLTYYALNAVSAGWAIAAHVLRGSSSTNASRGGKFLPSRASS